MIFIGISLALFFFVEWLLTFATVYQHPIWIPPQWVAHIAFWLMIVLAVIGGIWAYRKK